MKRIPRCTNKKCEREYADGGTYYLPLTQMWIRQRINGKLTWKKVGYWCKECKRFYTLDVENQCKKKMKKEKQ